MSNADEFEWINKAARDGSLFIDGQRTPRDWRRAIGSNIVQRLIAKGIDDIGEEPDGYIDWHATIDKFDNSVSTVFLRGQDHYYKLVHFTPLYREKQRAHLYGGRNKFFRIEWFEPQSDTKASWIKMAGYQMGWGDGDVLYCDGRPEGRPDFTDKLSVILDNDFELFIVTILRAIKDLPFWESKPLAHTRAFEERNTIAPTEPLNPNKAP